MSVDQAIDFWLQQIDGCALRVCFERAALQPHPTQRD